ncbi:MAG: hypothetical protein R3C01_10265 [Planctomycetaceae bacterium]
MRHLMLAFSAASLIAMAATPADAARRSNGSYRSYRNGGYQTTTTYSRPQRTGIFAALMRIERAKNDFLFGR